MFSPRFGDIRFVLSVAMLLRLLWFAVIMLANMDEGFYQPDTDKFWMGAQGISEQFKFIYDYGDWWEYAHQIMPGYSAFISLFMFTKWVTVIVVLVQIAMSIATCWYTYKLVLMLFHYKRAAIIAAWFMALDMPSIVFSNLIMTETLFSVVFIAAIYYLVKGMKQGDRGFMLAAVLLGIGVATRAVASFIPIVLLLFMLIYRGQYQYKLKHIAIVVLLPLAITSLWMWRNNERFGEPFIASTSHNNLAYYTAASVISQKEGISLPAAQAQIDRMRVKRLIKERPATRKTVALTMRFNKAIAIDIISDNPMSFIRHAVKAVVKMMFQPARGDIEMQLGNSKGYYPIYGAGSLKDDLFLRFTKSTSMFTIVVVIVQLLLLFVLWGGWLFGTLHLVKQKNYFPLVLAVLIIGYFCVMAAGADTAARFRIPMMPLIAMVASVGLVRLKPEQ